MKKVRVMMISMMAVAILGIAACGGGSTEVKSEQSTYTTTLGQELKDLEDAYKKGIITQKQYEESKARLIEQRTKKQ